MSKSGVVEARLIGNNNNNIKSLRERIQGEGSINIHVDEESQLEFGEFTYREISTRSWLMPGCMMIDFLSTSGWSPRTWYEETLPTITTSTSIEEEDSTSTKITTIYNIERKFWRWYCKAQPDSINHLRIYHPNDDDGTQLKGMITIIPDFTSQQEEEAAVEDDVEEIEADSSLLSPRTLSTTVKCKPSGEDLHSCRFNGKCGIMCNIVKLPWTGREVIDLTIEWDDN